MILSTIKDPYNRLVGTALGACVFSAGQPEVEQALYEFASTVIDAYIKLEDELQTQKNPTGWQTDQANDTNIQGQYNRLEDKMQKWTAQQICQLKDLVYSGKANHEIAVAMDMPIDKIEQQRAIQRILPGDVSAILAGERVRWEADPAVKGALEGLLAEIDVVIRRETTDPADAAIYRDMASGIINVISLGEWIANNRRV